MRRGRIDSWTWTPGFHDAAESVFPRVLARVFATLLSSCFPSSYGYVRTLRDGTDPLLGGHGAVPGGSHTMSGSRSGGRS